MSWLKKFGQDVLKGFEYVIGIADKLLPFLPGVATAAEVALPADAPLIAAAADVATQGINFANWINQNIQSFVGAASPEQLIQTVSTFVAQGVQKWFAANFYGTAKVSNQTLFETSINQISQGLIGILNSASVDLSKISVAAVGTDVLTNIVKYVQWAEQAANVLLPGAQAGSQKAASISSEVQSLIKNWLSLDLVGSGDIKNQTLFEQSVANIQNGAVGIVNSLESNVKTVSIVKS